VNRSERTNEPNEVKTMSSTTTQRMKIGDFLLRRLKEAGIRHLFGVPGDYNLELLQQLQDTGALNWVGTCSELNASHAAAAMRG
jgi:indolepyruvate decarboxylase